MVKPALSYLDIIRDVRNEFNLPVVAYNVSGEYAMVKAASQNGWIDEDKLVIEMLSSMKRVVRYHSYLFRERCSKNIEQSIREDIIDE